MSDLARLAADLRGASRSTQRRADKVVRKVGLDVERDMKLNIHHHDLIDTGFMIGSVGMDPIGPAHVIVGPTAKYALFHELGTATIPPRPFAGPAAMKNEEPFVKAMEQLGGEIL